MSNNRVKISNKFERQIMLSFKAKIEKKYQLCQVKSSLIAAGKT
jgi:hypothetical protein